MEKKDLIELIDNVTRDKFYKRKGNYWVLTETDLTKMINLQKSNYGNQFYLNFGFIINDLPLENSMMHISSRLADKEKEKQNRITTILDLENNCQDSVRKAELEQLMNEKIMSQLNIINTKEDLLLHLKSRPHTNDIPLIVKKHLDF